MNKSQIKMLQRHRTRWSDHVESLNWLRIPAELKREFSSEDFKTFVNLPFIRLEGHGTILVNEAFDGWETMRDLLSAIDIFPDSLLIDIYNMDKDKRKNVSISNIVGKDEDETIRNLVFILIPEIMWARGKSITEKPAII